MRRGRGEDGVRLSCGDVGMDVGECRVLRERHHDRVVIIVDDRSFSVQVIVLGGELSRTKQVISS